MKKILNLVLALMILSHTYGQDILLSDFEQSTYVWLPTSETWTVTGTCFGTGPAHGTLSGQNAVTGYLGKGLVNTFLNGDGSTGTLTSPSFTITRKYLRFVIGAGNWRPQTSINLIVDGVVVRTAVGMGDREQLDWLQWNVSGLLNKTAKIQIVDKATAGWGHLNVDQIIATDASTLGVIVPGKKYLLLPVKTGATKRLVELVQEGLVVREMNVELSSTPDYWAFIDMTPFTGQELVVRLDSKRAIPAELQNFFVQSDSITTATPIYQETLRPIYHFSAKRGFLADPCGLVYKNGEYHISYQHNQFGTAWDNMTHGHAVSTDLVHWRELPESIIETYWGEAWNGTSVVDWNNTSGFGFQSVVSIYTSGAGYDNNPRMSQPNYFAQSLAYSTDHGRTFNYYQGNPVLPNVIGSNRDPKVFWYAPGNVWVMVLFMNGTTYNIYNSTNLKSWIFASTIDFPETEETVDLYPLSVDGNTNNVKWVFSAGYRRYMVGTFDGKKFISQYGPFWLGRQKWDLSAAMTFSDIPATDGRRIMVSNGRTEYPGMPFNRYMNLPNVLTLKTINGVPKLHINPVAEVSKLRTDTTAWSSQTLNAGVNLMKGLSGEGVEMEIVFKPQSNSLVTFSVGGYYIKYYTSLKIIAAGEAGNVQNRSLSPVDGKVHIRAFYDRGSWELFANEGEFYMPIVITPKAGNWPLSLTTENASIEIVSLNLHHLGSIWDNGGIDTLTTSAKAMEDFELKQSSFYPNPCNNNLHFNNYHSAISLELFDLNGKLRLKHPLENGQNEINVSSVKQGIYLAKVISNNSVSTFKIIKK